ncbi:hypothetical protein L207DRAFT_623669 [Hyaloscypha variabilis F]|uniref:Uncharacterized protein n=1 Tax=Hyaloscypha variabilis (strain UAMH 11265 / GT02V1 / F) TaxID=1149755 RepID=A0A2J6RSG2_HYAVF|nr:hypothetical protein L207DRAFT_623669 [Hyaloscypha variabilis F]
MPSTPQSVKQRQIASSDATSPSPVLPTRCSYDAGHPLTPPAEPLESQDLMDNNADISQRTNERKSRLLSADEEDNRGDEALRSGDNGSPRSHDCNNNIVRCHTRKKTGKSFKLRTKVAAKPFKAHEDFVLKDGTMVVNAGGLWCLNRESNNVPHGPRHKNSKLSTRNKRNKNRSDRKSGKAGRSERMKCGIPGLHHILGHRKGPGHFYPAPYDSYHPHLNLYIFINYGPIRDLIGPFSSSRFPLLKETKII